jgi:cob(I)alamin adenosyltransferase
MGDLVALLTRWLALYAGEYDEALVHMCGEAEAAVVTEARALLRKIEGG